MRLQALCFALSAVCLVVGHTCAAQTQRGGPETEAATDEASLRGEGMCKFHRSDVRPSIDKKGVGGKLLLPSHQKAVLVALCCRVRSGDRSQQHSPARKCSTALDQPR